MSTKFETLCNQVAERYGLQEPMFFTDNQKQDPFEDDGNLHVMRRGLRAVFGIGDEVPSEEYNHLTRCILTDLGLEKKINDRVLLEEEDGDEYEDEYCSHCGRGGY